MSDSIVRSRIDPNIKNEANQILNSMGLTISEGIRLFLYQVISTKSLPFSIKAPNLETIEAMKETNNGEGLEKTNIKKLAEEWDA